MNAWTVRHDTVQWALIWVLRRLRGNVSAVGKRDMFGSAAMATVGRALYADIVAYHWRAPGRHLWVDVAVTSTVMKSRADKQALARFALQLGGG